MLFSVMLAVAAGAMGPIQTSSNSRLRKDVIDPYLSALVSFGTGTIILILLSIAMKEKPIIGFQELVLIPWWGYLAGIFATICATVNILLFPILGSVETVILPMVGELVASVVIDHFGWFNAATRSLTLLRTLGVATVIASLFFIVVYPARKLEKINGTKGNKVQHKFIWQLIGILSGVFYGIEAAINGHNGRLIASPIHATFLIFLTSAVILFVIVMARGNLSLFKNTAKKKTPWWAYIGGLLGSSYIFLNALLIPQLGNGTVMVLLIAGQILISLFIDNFGWLGAQKRKIELVQFLGLGCMILGIILINNF